MASFWGIVAAGILLRVLVVVYAGNGVSTHLSGGSDAPAYILLAHNLADGRGYTYAGYPDAYRAPIYPILLAGAIKVFGGHALAAMRWFQFLEGLATAFLCAATARRLFGEKAKRAALVFALFFPTLVMMTGEILTETTAALFSALFFYLLVRYLERPHWGILTVLAAVAGLATVVRFNMALYGMVLLCTVLFMKPGLPRLRSAAVVILVSGIVLSPWLIRNFIVFKGACLLSTGSGITAAVGTFGPQGRTLPGETGKMRDALGWAPPVDMETNDASRRRLGPEPTLNQQAWQVVYAVWRNEGFQLVLLSLQKVGYFLLSTEQLLSTASFPPSIRLVRAGGVLAYWALLALAVGGWFELRRHKRDLAYLILLYVVFVAVAHLPFAMNTRLRIPFTDPLIAVLAGGGLAAGVFRKSSDQDAAALNAAPE